MSKSSRPTGKTRGSPGTSSTHRAPAFGVVRGGDDPRRLVEQVVHEVGPRRRPARRRPRCCCGRDVDPVAEHRDLAVDGDAARRDELLAGAPGAEPGARQDLLDALAARTRSGSPRQSVGFGCELGRIRRPRRPWGRRRDAARARAPRRRSRRGRSRPAAAGRRASRGPGVRGTTSSCRRGRRGRGRGRARTPRRSRAGSACCSVDSTLTPRMAEIWPREIGCLYATIASVSSAGAESRTCWPSSTKCSTYGARSGCVWNR